MLDSKAEYHLLKAEPDQLNSSAPEKSVLSKIAQATFFVFGFGVVVLYIKSSQNCVEDLACIDQLLRKLPPEYSKAALVVCGGAEFGFSSGICAIEAIPAYLEYINKYEGIEKFIRGGGVLLAAGVATLETFLVAMKAFDTPEEAFASPNTWISMIAIYPMILYGVVNIMRKDVPHLVSSIHQKRGYYQGRPLDERYDLLKKKYDSFKTTTAAKWHALIPQASTMIVTADAKKKPLQFLYEAKLPVKPQTHSMGKWLAKGALGTIGMISSIGSIAPLATNTYGVLSDLLLDDNSSKFYAFLVGVLSVTLGLARDRAVIGKTVGGAVAFADWSPDYDLRLQLNPKLTIAALTLSLPMAYFSYAVLKMAALGNFDDPYREPVAEASAYSIEFSHLVFSLSLLSKTLMDYGRHDLYRVQAEVEKVLSYSLEEFDHFIRGLKPDEQALYLDVLPNTDDAELLGLVAPEVESKEAELNQEVGSWSERVHDPEREPLLSGQAAAPPRQDSVTAAPKQSLAKRICCWWQKPATDPVAPAPQKASAIAFWV